MTTILKSKQLGRSQALTKEGFLFCEGVPIARCGTLLYGEHELSGLEGKSGLIRVTRKPEDVFRPESINSFSGKPVIITHDAGLVTPENWKEAVVGTVLNPRRGEGMDDDKLLADLLIMDQDAIDEIREKTEKEGKGPEVSAGYDAEYEQTEPGFARQYNILANHVALVDQGRCGTTCAIGDAHMTTPAKNTKGKRSARARLTKDAIRRAFATRDEEMLEEALEDVQPDSLGNNIPEDMTGGGDVGAKATGTTINVNINGAGGSDDVTTDEGAPDGGSAAPPAPGGSAAPAAGGEAVPAWAQGLINNVQALTQRMDAIEAAVQPNDAPDDAGGGGEVDPTTDEDGGKDDDKKPTMDSAGVSAMFRDTMQRAEFLAPGFTLPTFDGAKTAGVNFKTLCDARRQVLAKATADAAMAEVIKPITEGHDFAKLTCDQLGLVFRGASELARAHNNKKTATVSSAGRIFGGGSKVMTPAEINKANREKYGYA